METVTRADELQIVENSDVAVSGERYAAPMKTPINPD